MKKLLVVDGMNLAFQMFYGMPARIVNSQGRAIQGTLGFVGALLKMIRMISPTHIVALFDGETHNPRCDIDEDYKANRPDYSDLPEEETPFSQLPDIYASLDHLGIKHIETSDCEADDVISAYSSLASDQTKVIIASFDSDFFQLINENTSVLRYRSDKTVICDETYIKQKLGIAPKQYADFKSLTGDTADNIKGAEKIGPKTAAALLSEFGGLEGIIAHADEIKKPSVRESLLKNAERLRKNYSLIKLGRDAKLPFELDELEYTHRGETTTQVLQAVGVR